VCLPTCVVSGFSRTVITVRLKADTTYEHDRR
jgi:hypothetical protein